MISLYQLCEYLAGINFTVNVWGAAPACRALKITYACATLRHWRLKVLEVPGLAQDHAADAHVRQAGDALLHDWALSQSTLLLPTAAPIS